MSRNASTSPIRPRKRNYPRAQLSLKVKYQSPSSTGKDGFTGTMGGGGVFIETVNPFPLGNEIVLDFALPGKAGHVRVEGVVVWVRSGFEAKDLKPGMGVQFKKVQDEDRDKILDLVMRILMGKPEEG